MSKETKNKLVPKLRFPEFKDLDGWQEETLGGICDYWNGASHEGGVVENGDYYLISLNSIDINGKLKSEMKRLSYTDNSLRKNDLVMVLSDVAHGNFLGLTDIIPNNQFVLNQRMAGLRIKDINAINAFFLRTFINCNQTYFKQKGQGSSQLNLSKSAVIEFPVLLPKAPNEQQKIADTLSSLDEYLEAQIDKLEALKAHKKGLIQQLFPAVGETVPKLRFEEFKDAGEWVEKILEKLTVKIGDGIHTTPIYDETGDYYFINGNNLIDGNIYVDENTKRVSENEYIKYKKDLNEDTILLSINGTVGNISFYNNEKVVLGKSACYINSSKELNTIFLFYSLQTDRIKDYFESELTGSTIKNLSLKSIRETVFTIPPNPDEQNKIADCLSSLAELVTAHANKIEALKEHKKGLMQGLFPAVNESVTN